MPESKLAKNTKPMEQWTTGELLTHFRPHLLEALPKGMSIQRLLRMANNAVSRSKRLKECTPMSILASVVECVQLGLEPDPIMGEIYIVPYKNIATPIVGYKGYLKLVYQTSVIYSITRRIVRDGEEFSVSYGTNPCICHKPLNHGEENGNSKWLGVYAVAHHKDGHYDFEWLERDDVFRRRNRSQAYRTGMKDSTKRDSPWFTDELSMWLKTAVRALAGGLEKSTADNRLSRAVALDNADAGLMKPTPLGWDMLPVVEGNGEAETGPMEGSVIREKPKSDTIPYTTACDMRSQCEEVGVDVGDVLRSMRHSGKLEDLPASRREDFNKTLSTHMKK